MLDDETLMLVHEFIRAAEPYRDGVLRMKSTPIDCLICVRDGRAWLDLPVLGVPVSLDLVRGIAVSGRIGTTIVIPPVLLAPRAVIDAAWGVGADDDDDETDDDQAAAAD